MFSPKISQAKALVRFPRCGAPQEAAREKNYSGFGCSLKPEMDVSGKRSAARGGLTTQADRLGLHGSEKMQNEDDIRLLSKLMLTDNVQESDLASPPWPRVGGHGGNRPPCHMTIVEWK
jgi:hypothetical protein